MIAVDDRNCLSFRPDAVRLLQAAPVARSRNPGPRHQLNVLQQHAPRHKLQLRWIDRNRSISFATMTEHLAPRLEFASERWVFGIGLRHSARPGITALLSA